MPCSSRSLLCLPRDLRLQPPGASIKKHSGHMQVCKSGVTRLRKIWLTRHGESEYNRLSLLGGDSNITDTGRAYAAVLPDIVIDRVPLVLPDCRASHQLACHCSSLGHFCPRQSCIGHFVGLAQFLQALAHCLTRAIWPRVLLP